MQWSEVRIVSLSLLQISPSTYITALSQLTVTYQEDGRALSSVSAAA